MVRLQLDVFHVRRAGPDILGGDVAAAQRFDEASVRPEERFTIQSLGCLR